MNQAITIRLTLFSLTLAVAFSANRQCDAQLFSKLRSEYGKNSSLTYGPDDASIRSRLFNLHTGHAGAYYNCDGEEEKRHSPYIKWKTVTGRSLPPLFWDIRHWKRDKAEIAQRICDGGCCNDDCGNGDCGHSAKRKKFGFAPRHQQPCDCCKSGNPHPTGQRLAVMENGPAADIESTPQPIESKKPTGLMASLKKVGTLGTQQPHAQTPLAKAQSPSSRSTSVLNKPTRSVGLLTNEPRRR